MVNGEWNSLFRCQESDVRCQRTTKYKKQPYSFRMTHLFVFEPQTFQTKFFAPLQKYNLSFIIYHSTLNLAIPFIIYHLTFIIHFFLFPKKTFIFVVNSQKISKKL